MRGGETMRDVSLKDILEAVEEYENNGDDEE